MDTMMGINIMSEIIAMSDEDGMPDTNDIDGTHGVCTMTAVIVMANRHGVKGLKDHTMNDMTFNDLTELGKLLNKCATDDCMDACFLRTLARKTDVRRAPHPRAAKFPRTSANDAASSEGPNLAPLRPQRKGFGAQTAQNIRQRARALKLPNYGLAPPHLLTPSQPQLSWCRWRTKPARVEGMKKEAKHQGRCGASTCHPNSARAIANACSALPGGMRRNQKGKRVAARLNVLLCTIHQGRSARANTIILPEHRTSLHGARFQQSPRAARRSVSPAVAAECHTTQTRPPPLSRREAVFKTRATSVEATQRVCHPIFARTLAHRGTPRASTEELA